MPPLAETQVPLPPNYKRVEKTSLPSATLGLGQDLEPRFPINMRCPVPPTSFTPDSSRQFYRGATVPQFRTFTLPSLASGSSSGGGTATATSGSSSTTTIISSGLSVKIASVVTPVINPGSYYFATITLAKAWVLLSMSVSSAARVRIYATPSAQSADAIRSDGTALNFETTSGVICDVTVDSPPWTWVMTPTPNGGNGDAPQSSNSYITVDNVSMSSSAYTITLQYVPLTS